MIDIKFTFVQLEMFIAVVDHGSFSAAARDLDRAQSAVSHAVGQLEASLQVALFDRSGRKPILTAAGQVLAEQARRLLHQAREMEVLAEAWSGSARQAQFSMVIDMIFPVERLVLLLAELQKLHPRLALTVHTEARGAVTARLLQEDCQLGVAAVLLAELSSQVETTGVGAIDFVAVAAPSHPLAAWDGPIPLRELRRHTQIILEDRSHLSTDQQVGVVGTNTWRVGGQGTKLGLLRAGFGYGSMPVHMIGEDLESGRLIRLQPAHWPNPQLQIPLYAIHRSDRPAGPVTRDAIRLLGELNVNAGGAGKG